MDFLEKEFRHDHDCSRCVYYGTTWDSPTAAGQRDWYLCKSSLRDDYTSLIKRRSSIPHDYVSTALAGHAADFDFCREALRLGIIRLVPTDLGR